MLAAYRHRLSNPPQPVFEPPTGEDWEDWDALSAEAAALPSPVPLVLHYETLEENGASEEELKVAKKAMNEAVAAEMRVYEKQVAWSQKFGFRNFDHLYEVRDSVQ